MNEVETERFNREGLRAATRRNNVSRIVYYPPATSYEPNTNVNGEVAEVDNTPGTGNGRIYTDMLGRSEDTTGVWKLNEGIRREELRSNRSLTGGGVDNSRRRTVGVSSSNSSNNISSGENISSGVQTSRQTDSSNNISSGENISSGVQTSRQTGSSNNFSSGINGSTLASNVMASARRAEVQETIPTTITRASKCMKEQERTKLQL